MALTAADGTQSGSGTIGANAGSVLPASGSRVASTGSQNPVVPTGAPTTQGLVLLIGPGQATATITLIGD